MNLVLVSGRYAAPMVRHSADAAFVQELVAAGCTVRWVTPVAAADAAPDAVSGESVAGLRVIPVASPAPAFRAVQGRLVDRATERAVAATIRADLPDLVHGLDFGGATSANVAWVADRLGVPSVVSMNALATVCHRGDLLHADGSQCAEWDSTVRCAACCLRPTRGGLGFLGSTIGRALGVLRSPVNPFPTPLDFANRNELIVGGVQVARRIVVDSAAARDRVASLGLRGEQIEVLPGRAVSDWLRLYRSVVEAITALSS